MYKLIDEPKLELSFRSAYARFAPDSGDNSEYLTPQVVFRLSRHLLKHSQVFADCGIGYSIPLSEQNEFEGFSIPIDLGISWKPIPIIDMEFFMSLVPFLISDNETDYSSYGGGIGFVYHFGFKDCDKDWVPDEIDTCQYSPKNSKVDAMGCAYDTDGDGVFDGLDKCPDTPWTAFVDELGCPRDSDNDGVFNGVDRCPDTPGDIEVDSSGCPKDSDGDGVPNYLDECLNTPHGALTDEKGCSRDSDEDGVYDGIDQCPQTPSGFVVNSLGCPFVTPVELEEVRDAYESSLNIKASAMQKLDNIAERLRAYPFRIVEIGVYTDSEGSFTYNINRGMRVAEKVKEILIARGVSAEQLVLKGYGEVDLISPNSTVDGLKQNRRIVFRYLNNY
ncbi:OmpA family protein [bacterium]|nr:OmpA family protein [bacterium]